MIAVRIKQSMTLYLVCYPWEYNYVPYDEYERAFLACSIVAKRDLPCPWRSQPIQRARDWINRIFGSCQKSRWYRGVHYLLTKDRKLHIHNLTLNKVLDFAICQDYLYVLTSTDLMQYKILKELGLCPNSDKLSYLPWDRVVIEVETPAQPIAIVVQLCRGVCQACDDEVCDDRHILRLSRYDDK